MVYTAIIQTMIGFVLPGYFFICHDSRCTGGRDEAIRCFAKKCFCHGSFSGGPLLWSGSAFWPLRPAPAMQAV